jgi:hypothetical protein
MGLALGSPVCIYGPELLRPAFKPSTAAVSVCKEAALSTEEPEGSDIWGTCIARRLIDSGAGFRRLGKLCVRGEYESRQEYERRISCYLEEGQELLYEFTSSTPVAFAFPWWQQSPFAEKTLKELGYRMTFSGNDLCRRQSASGIPRLFINNETPRPLNLSLLVEHQRKNTLGRLRALAMRALYA